MGDREKHLKEFVLEQGAAKVGITTKERLEGPPSADPTYVLPEAHSVISFLVPLDEQVIRGFLGKTDYLSHCDMMYDKYQLLGHIGKSLVEMLGREGFKAVAPTPNGGYRGGFNVAKGLIPAFSHRFAAAASGLGLFGWSGALMTPEYGSKVYLGSVVTDAVLEPDDPMEDNPCDGCRTCVKSCVAGFMDMKETQTAMLGGLELTYARKGSHARCAIGCGGFTGLSPDKKWSTWSTGRYEIPEDDAALLKLLGELASQPKNRDTNRWVREYQGDVNEAGVLARPKEYTRPTCGNCVLVCWQMREERDEMWNLLRSSGVVIEGKDSQKLVMSAEEAEEYLAKHPD